MEYVMFSFICQANIINQVNQLESDLPFTLLTFIEETLSPYVIVQCAVKWSSTAFSLQKNLIQFQNRQNKIQNNILVTYFKTLYQFVFVRNFQCVLKVL